MRIKILDLFLLVRVTRESTTRLKPDLNHKAVLELGRDLVALEEVQRKVVDPTETDNSSQTSRTTDGTRVNSSCEALALNTASIENCV